MPAPYGYQIPTPVPYRYPTQNNQFRNQNNNQRDLEVRALKSMREQGVISQKEYNARLRQLGY